MAIEMRTNEIKPVDVKEIEKFVLSPEYAKIKAEVEATKARVGNFLSSKAKTNDDIVDGILEAHEKRLAYNAAYQRDLRTIKRLGLSVTVAEWRKTNGS